MAGLLLNVPAELKTHGRQNFGPKIVFAARSETLVERGGKDGGGRGGFNRGENGPAAFAGIGNAAGKAFERGLLKQRNGGESQQPGSDDAAATPHFGDICEIEIELVVFRIAQRSGFRIGLTMG